METSLKGNNLLLAECKKWKLYKRKCVNRQNPYLVKQVEQTLEMARLKVKRKRKENDSLPGGVRKKYKATVDWNSLRY